MKTVLQEIVDRLPGSLGVAIIGLDGIPVEKVSAAGGFNIEQASIEGINVVKRALTSGAEPRDRVEEVSLAGRSGLTILRAIGSDYYLCLVIGPGCLAGRARYEAWRAGLALQQAIG